MLAKFGFSKRKNFKRQLEAPVHSSCTSFREQFPVTLSSISLVQFAALNKCAVFRTVFQSTWTPRWRLVDVGVLFVVSQWNYLTFPASRRVLVVIQGVPTALLCVRYTKTKFVSVPPASSAASSCRQDCGFSRSFFFYGSGEACAATVHASCQHTLNFATQK